ncbi:MAG: heterodisulfide reductase [Deltaproteobacteria bacterium]|nr:MAG: heterodisulfide reductase [Deltaproteobacteria bacterium]
MDNIGLQKVGSVMVVGGGISGMQASLDLANAGFKVYLVERKASIGGIMPQLDKTFPTNDCSTCIISPKLIEVAKHPNIEIMAYCEIVEAQGQAGNFKIRINKKARYVDEDKCVSCGVCASKCPRTVPNEFNEGLNDRKAIYLTFTQAIPSVYTIDAERCAYFQKGKCRACEKFCENNAIDFGQKDRISEVNAGAIILATGFEVTDPMLRPEYGYDRYPNVITSIEFERFLSAAGPFEGHIQRPSDGKEPVKIGWIQCVGSRDASKGKDYCSYACCMYATKEAIIAREHDPRIQPTIFFIDIRAQGKGFDRYYERAKREHGVRYVRSMISRITEDPVTHDLEVHYLDQDGEFKDEVFDLMVLSVGFSPNAYCRDVAEKLGVSLDRFGFFENQPMDLVSTDREGIFVCGVAQGPKDIPDSVTQASSASAEAMAMLGEARNTLISEDKYPDEIPTLGEEPRIGVFVCHCGNNIASVVDVASVAEYALTLPNVVFADHFLFTCSTDTQTKIQDIIAEYSLNRVVIASCSPRTHESLFQDTARKAGLNKYLVEMANIRDQCSWVHSNVPEAATEKAKDLVRMSVARSLLLEPLYEFPFEVSQSALVIGGGMAGMTAALNLSDQGFRVYLVERDRELGGNALKLYYGPRGEDIRSLVQETIDNVSKDQRITIYTGAQVIGTSGHVGKFLSTIKVGESQEVISHGATIIATGGSEYKPEEYLYGKSPKVFTQREFQAILAQGDKFPRATNVVMIQCVGSRDERNPYCSRICCTQAVTNALRVKSNDPETEVFVLFRDIRTFGLYELLYKEAREAGVQFIRYDPSQMPSVRERDNGLEVKVFDQNLGEEMTLKADYLVLSVAIRPEESTRALATTLKLPLDEDGFFLEAHVKLRPLDFANAGYFLCGLAHGPKFLDESIAQAKGAAARAAEILSKDHMMVEAQVAVVDREKCVLCMTCARSCPFGVPKVGDDGFIRIDPAECHGCGICASACPRKLIQVQHMKDDQILAKEMALYG